MKLQKITDKIKNYGLTQSEIVSVTYENSRSFDDSVELKSFFRVIIRSSYGSGSLVNTELWLPENWNGVYIGLGNGGMAGDIQHYRFLKYIIEGYAVSQTDMGTSGGRNRGIANLELWKDFGWRSTHKMAEISKELILLHYGKNAEYSYFIGDSTGGQQAFSEAQRFPEDFDGIISGVPANNRIFLHTYFLWNHNHLKSKNKDRLFDEEEIKKITSCAVRFFQNNGDGVKGDNFISYPSNSSETVDAFIEFLNKTCPEFDLEQLTALKAVYNGPINPKTEKRIYNGLPIGAEIYDCGIRDCQAEESPHFYPFIWTFGEDYNGDNFDFDKDLDKVSDLLSKDLNSNNPDLTAFKNRGGKLISFSGSADPCVPFPDAVAYYKRVIDLIGDYKTTASFFRYFLMPGKDHGVTGNGCNSFFNEADEPTDLLDILRRWREEGIAPDFIKGGRIINGNTEFLRKLYPYSPESELSRILSPTCDISYLNK